VIDLHCHVLPDVDGGPVTLEESLDMARAAAGEGTRVLVATPT
jgi:protein-tyrosine phosphatase